MAETGPRQQTPALRWTMVFRGGALGDFVLTLPVLEALSRRGEAVHLVASPRHAELALAAGLAARSSRLDDPRWGALWAGGRMGEVRAALGLVERVVMLRPLEASAVTARLARCGVARDQVVVHDPRPPPDGSVHAADHLLAALGPVGTPAMPALQLPGVEAAAGGGGRGSRLLVVPGAGGDRKRWPRAHVRSLLQGWLRGGGEASILLGPVELERGEDWADAGVPVFADDRPVEAAARLAGADVVVGNDTGPSHLAAAVGTPVVALFGPSEPRTWAPRGERVRVLRAPDHTMAALAPERVLAAARELAAALAPIPRAGENAISTPAPASPRTD